MKKIVAANIISGISLIFLVVFGINYLIFKNSAIYTNYSIEIVNNPVTDNQDIQFVMTGTKKLECLANNVYGVAISQAGEKVILNEFTKLYIRNIEIGESVTNSWHLRKPPELHPGYWRVTMMGDWTCTFWVFKETKERQYDNILLVVE
jgi:hypothetical protein